ncbi:MAG: ABC transporter ATP-binding protein [Lachnospiraceae bacterium]|nr:ABC transporter ATP-binding protein [Lachnospiraceae bacterium]MDY5741433.1 ABC transporter ATP-binding protein [Lachnospiraceae bacterium]
MFIKNFFGSVDHHRIHQVLEMVKLKDDKKKFVHYSMGMKQRLGIALAILKRPKMILLDEPLNGLDPISIAQFRELLIELNKMEQVTVLISSHNLPELEQIATIYGIMDRGKMLQQIQHKDLVKRCCKSHLIRLKSTVTKNKSEKRFLYLKDKIIVPGDTKLDEVLLELKRNDFQISGIEDYQLSLEEYFRMRVKNEGII